MSFFLKVNIIKLISIKIILFDYFVDEIKRQLSLNKLILNRLRTNNLSMLQAKYSIGI